MHKGFVLASTFGKSEGIGSPELYTASVEGTIAVWQAEHSREGELMLLDHWSAHRGPVNELALDTGGGVISAGLDRTVGIWNRVNGRLMNRISGESGGILCVAVVGESIAAGCFDGRILLWESAAGKLFAELAGHSAAVTGLTFTPGGKLVSSSRDRTLRVWDIDNRLCEAVLEGHRHWVTRLKVSGDQVVSGSEDGNIMIWDPVGGKRIRSIPLPGSPPIWGLDVSRNGEFAVVGSGGSCCRVDLKSEEVAPLAGVADRSHRAVCICDQGTRVGLGNDAGDVVVYDLELGQVVGCATSDSPGPLAAALDGEGNVAVSYRDGSLRINRPSDGGSPSGRSTSDAHDFFAYTLRTLDDGRFASGAFDGRVGVWDARTGDRTHNLDHGAFVFSVIGSCSGSFVAGTASDWLLSAGDDTVRLWDLTDNSVAWEFSDPACGSHLFAGMNDSLIVATCEDGRLLVWNDMSAEHVEISVTEHMPCAVECLKDSNLVLVANANGEIILVDTHTAAVRVLHAGHEDWVRTLRVSADGRFVVSASQNCVACVYDLQSEALIFSHQLEGAVYPAADVADSGRLVLIDAGGEPHFLKLPPE